MRKNNIILRKCDIVNNRITYHYDVAGSWIKFFNLSEEFFVEYSEDISDIPESIAVIPWLVNVLPMAWVSDADIYLDDIDEAFYYSIGEFKKGYIDMYPKIEFLGGVHPKKITNNLHEPSSNRTAMFFSGGVDAFATLIAHADEYPILITLWGSDIFFDDLDGWDKVKGHAEETAKEFGCTNVFVKTCFRRFLNEAALTNFVYKKAGDGWWHGFQHGIGLIGHAAPIAYIHNLKMVYIASSYPPGLQGITCASSHTIDNHVRFASCQVSHDQGELNRQNKVKSICSFSKNKNIRLRVCWLRRDGSNCCECEKCYRTMMAIIAEMDDPNDYGFIFSDSTVKTIEAAIKSKTLLGTELIVPFWEDIQNAMLNNKSYFDDKPEYAFFMTADFSEYVMKP